MPRLEIRPDEMDAAENVMRAQLANFEEEMARIQNQVHSELQVCNGSLYEILKGSYDEQIQTIMNSTRENIELYIKKMRESNEALEDTTNTVSGILG